MAHWPSVRAHNHGQVVISYLDGDPVAHGHFWNGRRIIDVECPEAIPQADSVNDFGEVVAWRTFQVIRSTTGSCGATEVGRSRQSRHYQPCVEHKLPLSDRRQFRIDDTTIHAFLWEDGEMVDLNDLVAPVRCCTSGC